jgi:hypothetical protein
MAEYDQRVGRLLTSRPPRPSERDPRWLEFERIVSTALSNQIPQSLVDNAYRFILEQARYDSFSTFGEALFALCRDLKRQLSLQGQPLCLDELTMVDADLSLEDEVVRLSESRWLSSALSNLPEEEQTVIEVWLATNGNATETAKRLGITDMGLRDKLSRVIRRLREIAPKTKDLL